MPAVPYFGSDLLRVLGADEDAAVGVVVGPELGPDLEVPVRALRHQEAAFALVGDDRAVLDAPVGVPHALEVIQPLFAIDQRGPPAPGHPRGQRAADDGEAKSETCDQRPSFHDTSSP
jgi:hypothetical protein